MSSDRPKVLKPLLGFVRPYRSTLTLVFVCLVVLSVLNLAMPKVLGFVIDRVFRGQAPGGVVLSADERFTLLLKVLGVIALIYAARNFLFHLSKTRVIVVGERAAFDLRQRLIRHLHTLSVEFYQQNKPGKISARILQDVQSVKLFIQDELANVVINVGMLLCAVGIMLYMNWLLALVTFAVMPLHVLTYVLFSKPIKAYAREAKERIADVSGDLIEQFGGAATVAASATQVIEQEKFRETMRRSMRAQIKQSRYYIFQKVAADVLVGLGTIVLFGVGGYAVLYGLNGPKMEWGDFVAFSGIIGLLYPRQIELVSQAGKFAQTGASVERIMEILEIEPGVRESATAIPFEISRGRIEFRNVSFAYQNGPVLHDVSFTIEPREHVLVTGPSGAGKSTCVNLIPRFFDPTGGSILIDGVDVRDFTLDSLRRQIGFVFQDCFLFNDTIMANIRYAWPDADDAAVIEAAREAYADEFIERLPGAYNTIIGEGGIQLSQGQKRRLMIARAILKNPRVLILDEPLVSLDAYARKQTVKAIRSMVRNRTVVTITHYPAEMPYADKQIYICNGQAVVTALKGAS